MRLLRSLFYRVRGLLRAETIHREIDEEARFHIEMRKEENIRRGMSPEEARRDAERRFGNLTRTKERGDEVRGGRWLETLWQDLRYAARMLLKNPGFTLIAMLTLALGVGANTTIFSVVNAVLLRSLPFRDPDQLVLVSHFPLESRGYYAYDVDFMDWRDQVKSFERIAAYRSGTVDLTGGVEPERLSTSLVSADLFVTLGITPALGRAFTPEEDVDGGPPVVILSDSLWRRSFGGDPHVVGRGLTACRYPNFCAKWMFTFLACGAGGGIKPGVERGSAEPQVRPVLLFKPTKRATAIGFRNDVRLWAVARFAGSMRTMPFSWGSALPRFTPGFTPPPRIRGLRM